MIIEIQVDVSIYLILSWFDERVNWTNISSRQIHPLLENLNKYKT